MRPGSEILNSLRQASAWANEADYDPGAVSVFLEAADYYLVAQAHAAGVTLVTHERPSTSRKRIKIPDACLGLGIKCMNPYVMLKIEQARFVLGPS